MLTNKKIPFWYIFNKVKKDMTVVTVFSVLIISASIFFDIDLSIPVAIPAFMGTAITLVLAFKLNQSYDRWWEARKIWGSIVNDSRTFVVQLRSFSINKKTNSWEEQVKRMSLRQIAWCYSLSNSLRNLGFSSIAKLYLSKNDVTYLRKFKNIPLGIIDLNAQDLSVLYKNKMVNEFQQIQIDSTMVRLVDSMGRAERIKGTVFPKTYRIFLHFFLYIFLLTLTMALTDLNGIYELALLIIIALPFFLLNRTAFHMQDPFEDRPTDTATDSIASTIEQDIMQLVSEDGWQEKKNFSREFYDK